jgi:branched-subunit amino acid aminotransferase/4-amino-4-deoxychorismate lyase
MPRGRRRSNADALMTSAEFIGWALGALEREITETRQRLAALTDQARRLRTGRSGRTRGPAAAATFDEPGATSATGAPRRRRRRGKMSAEARKRISEQMRKRWAERRRAGKKTL